MRRDQRSCDAGGRPLTGPNQQNYTRDGRRSQQDAPTGSRPGRPCTTYPQLPKEGSTTTMDRRPTGETARTGTTGRDPPRPAWLARRPHPSSVSRKWGPRDAAYRPAHRHLREVLRSGPIGACHVRVYAAGVTGNHRRPGIPAQPLPPAERATRARRASPDRWESCQIGPATIT